MLSHRLIAPFVLAATLLVGCSSTEATDSTTNAQQPSNAAPQITTSAIPVPIADTNLTTTEEELREAGFTLASTLPKSPDGYVISIWTASDGVWAEILSPGIVLSIGIPETETATDPKTVWCQSRWGKQTTFTAFLGDFRDLLKTGAFKSSDQSQQPTGVIELTSIAQAVCYTQVPA